MPGLKQRVCQWCLSFADTRKKAYPWQTSPFLNLNAHLLPWLWGSESRIGFNASIFALSIGKFNSFSTTNCKLWIINSLLKVFHWLNPVLPYVNWFWSFSFWRDFCHYWDQPLFVLLHESPPEHILRSLFNFFGYLFVENPFLFHAFDLHLRVTQNNSNAYSKRQAVKYLNSPMWWPLFSSLKCPYSPLLQDLHWHIQISHCLFGVKPNLSLFSLGSTL